MSVPSKLILANLNDQYIEVDGVKNQTTGLFFNGGQVLATLFNPDGSQQAAEINNLACNYVANSNGVYRGQVANSFYQPPGTGYWLILQIAAGIYLATIRISVEVVTRRT